jgi:hypothetical protein
MDKAQVNLYLSTGTRDKLDMLVTATRKQTGLDTSRTTIVTVLVEAAASRLKRVERVMDGRKLIGFNGYYGDHQVAYEEKTEAQAQAKVDQYAHEELSK